MKEVHEMTTVNMQITGERLAAMDDNGMSVYCTPGGKPYWASQPIFMYDICVATPRDFLESNGYDELDDSILEETFSLEVELINPL